MYHCTIYADIIERFLLAKLHLDSLSRKISRKDIRLALHTLPTTLGGMYSESLQRVYSQDPESIELAESVLFWVMCASRPLTLSELQHVWATKQLPEDTELEEDDLPDGDILTSVCRGLIQVEAKTGEVRPVHYTTQQFFEDTYS
jgi:hypothetical protein